LVTHATKRQVFCGAEFNVFTGTATKVYVTNGAGLCECNFCF